MPDEHATVLVTRPAGSPRPRTARGRPAGVFHERGPAGPGVAEPDAAATTGRRIRTAVTEEDVHAAHRQ
ncbi:hypothetical protein ACE1N8_29855 [Streptomyces sp. DSM 116494]|uniref:hypothetical protein n=1 Tax=Streptomyces TaxID=1883 RepID=UPI0036506EEF